MSSLPPLGLGAAALLAWADAQKPDLTHAAVAAKIGVTPSTFHEWVTATWLDGSLPGALNRQKIETVTDGAVPASLFDKDDLRRLEARMALRAQRATPGGAA